MPVPHNVKGAIAALINSKATSTTIRRRPGYSTLFTVKQACDQLGVAYLDLRCVALDDTMARSYGYEGEIETGIDLMIDRASANTLIILDEADYLDELPECSRVIQEAISAGRKVVLIKYLDR